MVQVLLLILMMIMDVQLSGAVDQNSKAAQQYTISTTG